MLKLDRPHGTIMLTSPTGGAVDNRETFYGTQTTEHSLNILYWLAIAFIHAYLKTFLLQRKLKNVACFWERQPSGCVRINCAFRHSKPRHINGLFLPPTNNAPLPQGDQEGILLPAQCQGSLTSLENTVLPIHPPLIINLSDEEDDEEDDEEKDVSDWVPKTTEDIEEERAIKEICYKSGELYGIQQPDQRQSPSPVSSSQETELLPFEATQWDVQKDVSDCVPKTTEDIEEERAIKEICYKSGEFYGIQQPDQRQSPSPVSLSQETELLPFEATQWDLQKGDSNTIRPGLNNTYREGESMGRRVPKENISRTGCRSFENGGSRTASPEVQPSYQTNGQIKYGETSFPHERETGRKSYFCSSEPQRSAYVVYRTVTVTQEPKFTGPRDKHTSGSYNAPTRRKRNPQAKTFSKTKATIQRQKDMEVNHRREGYEDKREMKRDREFTKTRKIGEFLRGETKHAKNAHSKNNM
ncbi:uncharacterized protein C12orf50 homolog [Lathamus discolor]|uniref:uncharacterized protein C12orf50 homolog n=1 Tax=Lathamus discolor TaxID=678569 RepID=UPI0032B84364